MNKPKNIKKRKTFLAFQGLTNCVDSIAVTELTNKRKRKSERSKPSVVSEHSSQTAYTHDPDVQLMLRVKEGDDGAFAELVKAYQDRLIGIFTNMMQQGDMAEDLAQEVFMRIYRARNGYEPTAKFSTWLFRIANNLVSNTRRSKGRRKEVAMNIKDSGPLGPRPEEKLIAEKSALMPSRQVAKIEVQQVVRDALDTLNERQRMALLLHKFEGMSYIDIGETMEMSTSAVKSLLSRARESLRQRLEGYVK
ncbi:RNA polymerase ECF-type sigma factor [hydrothermal vent metagenome]|uniref:RNA polymerase ECF-type sigma factor n=1 Tax=hydrothermal vent metagenome TaxID=652676 RepID=A0A3B1DZC6_9ZZZZ